MDLSRITNRIILVFWVTPVLVLLSACSGGQTANLQNYYTWEGLEPDKWASVWLLENHTQPGATVEILPVGAEKRDAVAIDTPTANYKRVHGKSTYEGINAALGDQNDPVLIRIGEIVNNLEVNPWNVNSPLVSAVEQQFRALQLRYDRIGVPAECYTAFFNQLYALLSETDASDSLGILNGLNPEQLCIETAAKRDVDSPAQVFEYSITHILQMIDADKRVVFVDTREDEEFDAQHIPGAINIKLREVTEAIAESLQDADLVISYCIKDFRGYEVALALSRAGLGQSGIMKPYGIKGWRDSGLPVANAQITDSAALAVLKQCAANGGCS